LCKNIVSTLSVEGLHAYIRTLAGIIATSPADSAEDTEESGAQAKLGSAEWALDQVTFNYLTHLPMCRPVIWSE
jgi:hypothetical protein